MSRPTFLNSAFTILLLVVMLLLMLAFLKNHRTTEPFVSPLVYNATSPSLSGPTYRMGQYDGIVLSGQSRDYSMLPSSNAYSTTYQGFSGPMTKSLTTIMDNTENAPSVDGKEGSPRDLFMFAHNQCRPECCPSAFSCSGGCVCLTDAQKRLLSYRGHNSTYCNSTLIPQQGHPVGMFGAVDDV